MSREISVSIPDVEKSTEEFLKQFCGNIWNSYWRNANRKDLKNSRRICQLEILEEITKEIS